MEYDYKMKELQDYTMKELQDWGINGFFAS